MALDDKKLMAFTALFLAVSVSTIAKYADQISDAFGGSARIMAVDDVFTTRAGASQPLYVLLNDVGSSHVRSGNLHILQGPTCGNAVNAGRSVLYESTEACVGRQSFTYCISETGNGTSDCRAARVALHVKPKTASRQFALADTGDTDQSTESIQLGGGADRSPTRTSGGLFDIARTDRLAGDLADRSRQSSGDLRPAVEVASAGGGIVTPSLGAISLPRPPMGALDRAALPDGGVNLSLRVSEDSGLMLPEAPDKPISTSALCTPVMKTEARPGAMIHLSLTAGCHPAQRVMIVHDRIAFTMRTSAEGTLDVDIPALSRSAGVAVELEDGVMLSSRVAVPEVKDFARVSIQWSGAQNLDLHALEFGARPGSAGHVWPGQPRSADAALTSGGGFSVQLGDPTVAKPMQAEVYSYRRTGQQASGTIHMVVEVRGDSETCGQPFILFSQRNMFGLPNGTNGLQLTTPDCTATNSRILQSAVRDIKLARR